MFLQMILRCAIGRNIVSDAQKLLGRLDSYSALQNLLGSDVTSLALSVRKLLGTRHPLPQTMRYFFTNGHELFQTFSAIILLTSDACRQVKKDEDTTVTDSQRSLAEISEIIYAAHFIHLSVLNRLPQYPEPEDHLLSSGNKMAVLGGDYLLANASVALAKIGKPSVIAAVSTAISDMSIAALRRCSKGDRTLPSWVFHSVDEWHEQANMSIASLLSHCCSAAADLGNATSEVQELCFKFAKYVALLITIHVGSCSNRLKDHRVASDAQMYLPFLAADKSEIAKLKTEYFNNALLALNALPACKSVSSLKNFAESINLI